MMNSKKRRKNPAIKSKPHWCCKRFKMYLTWKYNDLKNAKNSENCCSWKRIYLKLMGTDWCMDERNTHIKRVKELWERDRERKREKRRRRRRRRRTKRRTSRRRTSQRERETKRDEQKETGEEGKNEHRAFEGNQYDHGWFCFAGRMDKKNTHIKNVKELWERQRGGRGGGEEEPEEEGHQPQNNWGEGEKEARGRKRDREAEKEREGRR
jgi:hypothetical protein